MGPKAREIEEHLPNWRDLECPKCGASSGEQCRKGQGQTQWQVHQARLNLARSRCVCGEINARNCPEHGGE